MQGTRQRTKSIPILTDNEGKALYDNQMGHFFGWIIFIGPIQFSARARLPGVHRTDYLLQWQAFGADLAYYRLWVNTKLKLEEKKPNSSH